MKKFCTAALAFVCSALILAGCRGNVSSHENGRITEPTMMPETIATMPSTDTVPPMTTMPTVTTEPSRSTEPSTQPTTGPNTESGAVTGKERPNRSMG